VRLVVGLVLLPALAAAADRRIEVGAENLYYRTGDAPQNRGNVLGLETHEDLLRGTLFWRESHGRFRAVLRGLVERQFGSGDETDLRAREAYLQYGFGEAVTVRAGRQRIAWGSGFAWNPTNRLEPPRNPLNTSLEQPGADAVRVDLIPSPRAGVILVASRSREDVSDLPYGREGRLRRGLAARARVLVADTDLALVVSGGDNVRTLVGLDVGRALFGPATGHVEASAYRGAEMPPARDDTLFFRVAAGLLYPHGERTSLSLEYFYNGEGYDDAAFDDYLAQLEGAARVMQDPLRPPEVRAAARDAYLATAAIPYAGGLGLRRHYLQASWSRGEPGGKWTAALRAVAGLDDGGVTFTPGVSFAPRGDLTLHLDAVLPVGPETAEYRLAPIRAAVQARARAIF
jgi:hypothetical protein